MGVKANPMPSPHKSSGLKSSAVLVKVHQLQQKEAISAYLSAAIDDHVARLEGLAEAIRAYDCRSAYHSIFSVAALDGPGPNTWIPMR